MDREYGDWGCRNRCIQIIRLISKCELRSMKHLSLIITTNYSLVSTILMFRKVSVYMYISYIKRYKKKVFLFNLDQIEFRPKLSEN
jgi:hypothetical protein